MTDSPASHGAGQRRTRRAAAVADTANTPLEFYARADIRPNESVDIERLLSSSYYPGSGAEQIQYQFTPSTSSDTVSHSESPELTAAIEQSPQCNIADRSTKGKNKEDKAQSATTRPPLAATAAAAGTKRKASDAGAENAEPSERRRKQIRDAQRAYRQRKISQTAYLEERVRQLESAIENMSSVVLSFSEELIGSNILTFQSDLTGRLRDALATCLALVRETGPGAADEEVAQPPSLPPHDRSMALVASPASIPRAIPLRRPPHIRSILGSVSFPETNTSITIGSFMDMVATSAVYYGYLALADPSLSNTRLYRHFGLALQVMDRDKLLSYFSSRFQDVFDRSTPRDMRPKPGMPFFTIGGAGTHYTPVLADHRSARSSTSAPLCLPWANTKDQASTWSMRNNAWTVPMDTSSVPEDIRDRFEGEWFDMQDLELFLKERGVSLQMKPVKDSQGDINAPLLLRGLMLNTTCLGQSPGFRRRDVEMSIEAARRPPPV